MPEIKKYLNRDGLDEYNSLLPHSSAEMQTYVNEWMDEHPEASTTVQDGAITERKLADKSVSLRTLADDTVHMLKGAILTGNLSGEVLTADDAYSAPPMALTVDGRSTQDGTPTPDAPVEIVDIEQVKLWFSGKNLCKLPVLSTWTTQNGVPTVGEMKRYEIYVGESNIPFTVSVTFAQRLSGTSSAKLYLSTFNSSEKSILFNGAQGRYSATGSSNQNGIIAMVIDWHYVSDSTFGPNVVDIQLELGTTATPYQPYNATSVLLNLTHALRSLPDGTKDTLALSYLRPSTREGWAWYSAEMVQAVGKFLATSPNGWVKSSKATNGYYKQVPQITDGRGARNTQNGIMAPWFKAANSVTEYYVTLNSCWVDSNVNFNIDPNIFTGTAAEFGSWVTTHNIEFFMPLVAPTTTTLNPIEMPILPAPDVTVWSDPTTGLQMEYVRDSNLVIQRIEQAIADQ